MKNILITGSSSGIGQGLAREFLSRKHRVWGVSRRAVPSLEKDDNYRHLQLDLTDYEEVNKKLPAFIEHVDQFDLVVLNAGILGKIKYAAQLSVDEMKKVTEINVWANKVLLDILMGSDTAIKQVAGMSSKASLRSTPGWGPYSMSKAGLNMLMNVYAKEHPDTHFIAFAPGLVDSEIQEQIYQVEDADRYPAAKRLQEARYTDEMPDANKAAPRLIEGIEKALEHESGSFVDVREM